MINAINRKSPRYFRIHASGDFYSEDYIKKFIEIVNACPQTLFRTTTRRKDLKELLNELNSLQNCIVRESLDKERKYPSIGLPFAAISNLDIVKKQTSYKCLENYTSCKHYCWKNRCNVNFDEL
jgi:hypothetical protein